MLPCSIVCEVSYMGAISSGPTAKAPSKGETRLGASTPHCTGNSNENTRFGGA
jgi:hypothetical protein